MRDRDFKPWLRGYSGWFGLYWWPVRWQGVLFALTLVAAAGLSLAAIVNGLISPAPLLLAEAIPVFFVMRVFMDRTEWIESRRRQRENNDLRS